MTIFRPRKNPAKTSAERSEDGRPQRRTVKKLALPFQNTSGNIFFALFAAVAMVGAVGFGFNTVLRGPITGMTDVTRRTVAENTVITTSRLAIVGATTMQAEGGDCDSDGSVEPLSFVTPTGAAPTGGGHLPAGLVPESKDPWNTEYGYCAWDSGSLSVSDNVAACEDSPGVSPNRLEGSPHGNQYAIAIISAGKDRAFQTSCNDYVDGDLDNLPDTPLLVKIDGSDDIVLGYSYAEANDLGNGLWREKTADPTTAEIDKGLEVTGGATFSDEVVLTGNVLTGGGLVLPGDPGDDSITGACDAVNDKQMRRNTADIPPTLEVCDFTGGLGWVPISGVSGGGGGGGGGGSTGRLVAQWKLDEAAGVAVEDSIGGFDGTLGGVATWQPDNGQHLGAILFSNANQAEITIPRDAALEPTAISIAFWMKRGATQDSYAKLIAKTWQNDGAPTYVSYAIGFSNTSDDMLDFSTGRAGGVHDVAAVTPIPADTWTHIVAIYDPAGPAPQKRLYINGVLDSSDTYTDAIIYDQTPTGNLFIGNNGGDNQDFNGNIDDVRIYNHAITDLQIQEILAATTPQKSMSQSSKAGKLFGWGDDDNQGQGNGTTVLDTTSPYALSGGDGFVQVSAGFAHACGVHQNGTAWCWGDGADHKLGDGGDDSDQGVMVQVGNITDAVKISAGRDHTCVLRSTGQAMCWGDSRNGALGTGNTTDSPVPVAVTGVEDFVDIAAGEGTSCGLTSMGTVYCWGEGQNGQLGGSANVASPTAIPTITDFIQISGAASNQVAYQGHFCGATKSGRAYCWGREAAGNFGNGAPSGDQGTPSQFGTFTDVAKIETNTLHTCALRAGGTIWCSGDDSNGELGNGSSGSQTSPTQVSNITDFVDVSVGVNATCGVRKSRELWCWGKNDLYQLGTGPASTASQQTPVKSNLNNVTALSMGERAFFAISDALTESSAIVNNKKSKLAAGTDFACAIDPSGVASCWGRGANGRLGNGNTFSMPTPINVSDAGPWLQISSAGNSFSASHTCGIKGDGQIWCWGAGTSGQLGNNSPSADSNVPVLVPTGTRRWSQVATGESFTCAIENNGELWCWGVDGGGQLGNGNFDTGSPIPSLSDEDGPWVKVSAGRTSACAIKADRSAWCWGVDNVGEQGDGPPSGINQWPTPVNSPGPWVDISAGEVSCGIKADGTLWCWGSLDQLALPNEPEWDNFSPQLMMDPGPWAKVESGFTNVCAIKMDGSAWCFGQGDNYRNGNNSTTDFSYPQALPGGGKYIDISVGNNFACGMQSDSSVYCWGRNNHGQIGNPATGAEAAIPTRVDMMPQKYGWTGNIDDTALTPLIGVNPTIGTSRWISDAGAANTGLNLGASGANQLRQSVANQFLIETDGANFTPQMTLRAAGAVAARSIGLDPTTGNFRIARNNAAGDEWLNTLLPDIEIDSDGNVGIATTGAPASKLDVNGAILIGSGGACTAGKKGTIQWDGTEMQYCDGTWQPLTATPGGAGGGWDTKKGSGSPGCWPKSNGELWCWGDSLDYRLGNNQDTVDSLTPTEVHTDSAPGGWSDWVSVRAGEASGCGLRANGTAWCWGNDELGWSGQNTSFGAPDQRPVQVRDTAGTGVWSDWVHISTGMSETRHTCGIRTNGKAYCWGNQQDGAIGNNTSASIAETPQEVHTDVGSPGWSDWTYIESGTYHTCGLRANGSAWCWGYNINGELGNGGVGFQQLRPVQVRDNSGGAAYWYDWIKISIFNNQACGVRTNGTAWCWGQNNVGQVGNNDIGDENRPVQVGSNGCSGPYTDWIDISVGEEPSNGYACGLRANGTVWCWGSNASGVLGDGTTTTRFCPVQVEDDAGTGFWTDWTSIQAGFRTTCGTRSNGTLWCWGEGTNGWLGDGNNADSTLPVQVSE